MNELEYKDPFFGSFSCTCTEHGGNLFKSKGQEECSNNSDLKGVLYK